MMASEPWGPDTDRVARVIELMKRAHLDPMRLVTALYALFVAARTEAVRAERRRMIERLQRVGARAKRKGERESSRDLAALVDELEARS